MKNINIKINMKIKKTLINKIRFWFFNLLLNPAIEFKFEGECDTYTNVFPISLNGEMSFTDDYDNFTYQMKQKPIDPCSN